MNQESRIKKIINKIRYLIHNSLFIIHKSRGFTLVELLIAIAVIGILAGGIIAIVNPAAQIQKANDARRKTDLFQIQKALETFYQDYGKYPDAVSSKIKSTRGDGSAADWGTDQWSPYMGNLPKDPSSPSKDYVYNSISDGQTYCIYASLDEGGPISTPGTCFPGASCGTAVCNYGVSSPNVSP